MDINMKKISIEKIHVRLNGYSPFVGASAALGHGQAHDVNVVLGKTRSCHAIKHDEKACH